MPPEKNRIGRRLVESRAAGRPLIIPYLTAGYPELSETVDLILAAEEGGADLIEVGLPLSDPLADGPTIQAASQRALANGMTHRRALDIMVEVRLRSDVPLLFMGYYNPLYCFGLSKFFEAMRDVGVDGVIIPDLPLEESVPVCEAASRWGRSMVFLIAPTTPNERLKHIDRVSTDFSYCVSLTGVTGARDSLEDGLPQYLNRVAAHVEKPFVVGFGISNPDQVRRVVPPAAGVVVGSALIRAMDHESTIQARRETVRRFVSQFRRLP